MVIFIDEFNVVQQALAKVPAIDNFNVAGPAAPSAPSTPTSFTAVAQNGGLKLTWTDPGAVPTSYRVVASGGPVPRTFDFTSPSPVTITGLTNATAYSLSLVASNSNGAATAATATGTPSSGGPTPGADGTLVVTPAALPPSAPTLLTATPGDTLAIVTWDPPADDGGSPINSYTITARSSANTQSVTVGSGATSSVINFLVNSVQYSVTMTASNGITLSPVSNTLLVTPLADLVVTPPTTPPPPVTGGHVHNQPRIYAFPVDRVFCPGNFGKMQAEVPTNA